MAESAFFPGPKTSESGARMEQETVVSLPTHDISTREDLGMLAVMEALAEDHQVTQRELSRRSGLHLKDDLAASRHDFTDLQDTGSRARSACRMGQTRSFRRTSDDCIEGQLLPAQAAGEGAGEIPAGDE